MDKMLERIWAWFRSCDWHKKWSKDKVTNEATQYLRSTPLLERAEEMRDVLKEVIVGVNIDESCTCFVCKAGRLLAAIEKAEEERGGG